MTYKFNNSKGEVFTACFDSFEKAQDFAYRCGYCCLGRA